MKWNKQKVMIFFFFCGGKPRGCHNYPPHYEFKRLLSNTKGILSLTFLSSSCVPSSPSQIYCYAHGPKLLMGFHPRLSVKDEFSAATGNSHLELRRIEMILKSEGSLGTELKF